jgi:hypothetical protein
MYISEIYEKLFYICVCGLWHVGPLLQLKKSIYATTTALIDIDILFYNAINILLLLFTYYFAIIHLNIKQTKNKVIKCIKRVWIMLWYLSMNIARRRIPEGSKRRSHRSETIFSRRTSQLIMSKINIGYLRMTVAVDIGQEAVKVVLRFPVSFSKNGETPRKPSTTVVELRAQIRRVTSPDSVLEDGQEIYSQTV